MGSSQAETHYALLTLMLTCSQPALCDSHVPRDVVGVGPSPQCGPSSNWDPGLFLSLERRIGWFLPVVLDQFLAVFFCSARIQDL